MNLLILGGTIFLGRYLVEAALARGHQVTLFNRGQHNSELYPDVEKLRGDRDGGLDVLRGRRWDAVVDTSGYVPRVVRASAELLADAVEHYTFISSISVYPHFRSVGLDESAPVGTLDDPTVEEITGESYGPLKALCEQAVEQALPGRTLVIRPGLIVGPHDYSDRFTYWVRRVAQGGELLAPAHPDWHTQIIDVRDLAEWTLRMVERRQTGVYNATGPEYDLTFGQLLETCRSGQRQRCALHLGQRGISARKRGDSLERAAALDSAIRPGYAGLLGYQLRQSHRGRAGLPRSRRDRARHAGVGCHTGRHRRATGAGAPAARRACARARAGIIASVAQPRINRTYTRHRFLPFVGYFRPAGRK